MIRPLRLATIVLPLACANGATGSGSSDEGGDAGATSGAASTSTGDATTAEAGDGGSDEAGDDGGAEPTVACFEDPELVVLADGPWDPWFADLDGDGRLDLVGTEGDFEGLRFVTFLGLDASPYFDHVGTVDAAGGGPGGRSGGPSFGDLQGDGLVDMLFANVVYVGDGAGALAFAGVPSLPFGFGGLATFVDLDDDGISDGLAANFDDPSAPIGTFFGVGNGNFVAGPTIALDSAAYGLAQSIPVGAPGGPDDVLVLVDDESCGGWGGGGGGGCATVRRRPVLMRNLGGGAFETTEGQTVDGSPIIRARADFSGDGAPDLIGSSGMGGTIAWLRHGPEFSGNQRIGELPLEEVGALEVDAEPGLDLVGLGDDGTGPAVIVYSGAPPDGVRDPWFEPLDFAPTRLRTFDLDFDGSLEILVFGMRNGEWTMAVLRPRACG